MWLIWLWVLWFFWEWVCDVFLFMGFVFKLIINLLCDIMFGFLFIGELFSWCELNMYDLDVFVVWLRGGEIVVWLSDGKILVLVFFNEMDGLENLIIFMFFEFGILFLMEGVLSFGKRRNECFWSINKMRKMRNIWEMCLLVCNKDEWWCLRWWFNKENFYIIEKVL